MSEPTSSFSTRPITQHRDGQSQSIDDNVAVEQPLEIRIGDEPLAVTMRTPGHDLDLAAGFCLTEGIILDPDDLEAVEPCAEAKFGNIVNVRLSPEAMLKRQEQITCSRREFYLSSSCGLCGKQSIDRIEQRISPITGNFTLSRQTLATFPEAMRARQGTFDQTGGLHAAAIFTPTGELKVLREDVGRHNAVDKAIGSMLLTNQLRLMRDAGVLMVSGRASFEIMQKAAVAGIAFVAAVSAPSSLAVDFARQTDMTLVGFLRPGRMNVYHDRGRLLE